jgi:serine/threonine protein phosphatase PrpC
MIKVAELTSLIISVIYCSTVNIMGSCSYKSERKGENPIKVVGNEVDTVKVSDNHTQKKLDTRDEKNIENNLETDKTEKKKYVIEINSEEPKVRKQKKALTVLSTNDDEIELSENLSLVKKRSMGKKEQGSLILVNSPVMFGGKISNEIQNQFEEKIMTIEGDDVKTDYLLEKGIWVSCRKGLKPDSPNQDDYVVVISNDSILLGVFDGHGTHGHEVSNFIHKIFPKVLINHPDWIENPINSITDAFLIVQTELIGYCHNKSVEFDCTFSGSTATLINIRDKTLYVGHVGDSRAVMCKKIKGKYIATELTRDHKPMLTDEHNRIVRMGGEVKKAEDDPNCPYRVFIKGKQYPGIAMSRSIGDVVAQSVGVVYNPEVNQIEITEDDEFVLICSDGVWEFITSQEAVELVQNYPNQLKNAAEALASLAWKKWIENEGDIVDDITVVIAGLKPLSPS